MFIGIIFFIFLVGFLDLGYLEGVTAAVGEKIQASENVKKSHRLVLLIDEVISSPLESTIYDGLYGALKEDKHVVVCSVAFLYSLLEKENTTSIDFLKWKCYHVKQSHLFAFVPDNEKILHFPLKNDYSLQLPLINTFICEEVDLSILKNEGKNAFLDKIKTYISLDFKNQFKFELVSIDGEDCLLDRHSFTAKILRFLLVHHIDEEKLDPSDILVLIHFIINSSDIYLRESNLSTKALEAIQNIFCDLIMKMVKIKEETSSEYTIRSFFSSLLSEERIFGEKILKILVRYIFRTFELLLVNPANENLKNRIPYVLRRFYESKIYEGKIDFDFTDQIENFVKKNDIQHSNNYEENKDLQIVDGLFFNQAQWNVLWIGHGGFLSPTLSKYPKAILSRGEIIKAKDILLAGTDQFTLQETLSFFNVCNVKSVFIMSCFSGGKARDYFVPLYNKYVFGRYRYTFGLASSTDTSVELSFRSENGVILNRVGDFFEAIENHNPNWLQRASFCLGRSIQEDLFMNVAQFLSPGADDFNILLPITSGKQAKDLNAERNRFGIVNNLLLKFLNKSDLSSRFIQFMNKELLFIYPTVVDHTIKIAPLTIVNSVSNSKGKTFTTANSRFLEICYSNYFSQFWQPKGFFKTLNSYVIPLKSFDLQYPYYHFPNFQSMKKGDAFHIFKRIDLIESEKVIHKHTTVDMVNQISRLEEKQSAASSYDNNKDISMWGKGIFTFLAQAFTRVKGRLSKKNFFIKELKGYYDLSFVKGKSFTIYPTTIYDVLIKTEGVTDNNYKDYDKILMLYRTGDKVYQDNDVYWLLEFDEQKGVSSKVWDFKQKTFDEVKDIYESGIMDDPKENIATWSKLKNLDEYDKKKPLVFQLFDLYPLLNK